MGGGNSAQKSRGLEGSRSNNKKNVGAEKKIEDQ